ncbi:MAG: glutathione S-transferase N-terminal domain-containing protein [Mariprofundales bacterium]
MIKLYSSPTHPESHRTRIVLEEKELPYEHIEIDDEILPDAFLEVNPYGALPTIMDRDTILGESHIINEYLDERYPHPPLKPGTPAERARMRFAVLQVERDWYPALADHDRVKKKTEPRRRLHQILEGLNMMMAREEYICGDVYTLADVAMAPILWRLVPIQALTIDRKVYPHVLAYAQRLFGRPAFERSLSEHEQMLHQYF